MGEYVEKTVSRVCRWVKYGIAAHKRGWRGVPLTPLFEEREGGQEEG